MAMEIITLLLFLVISPKDLSQTIPIVMIFELGFIRERLNNAMGWMTIAMVRWMKDIQSLPGIGIMTGMATETLVRPFNHVINPHIYGFRKGYRIVMMEMQMFIPAQQKYATALMTIATVLLMK